MTVSGQNGGSEERGKTEIKRKRKSWITEGSEYSYNDSQDPPCRSVESGGVQVQVQRGEAKGG